MVCEKCGHSFDHTEVIPLKTEGRVVLRCPKCRAPGPMFKETEYVFRLDGE